MSRQEVAEAVWEHLHTAGVADRARAVDTLAAYPHRWDLASQDVTTILDQYPPMEWDPPTTERFLQLVGEITPGGLPAVLAAVPDQWWVSPDAPAQTDTAGPIGAGAGTVRDHPDRGDPKAVAIGVDTAVLLLSVQGFITDQDPQTDPSPASIAEPGPVAGHAGSTGGRS